MDGLLSEMQRIAAPWRGTCATAIDYTLEQLRARETPLKSAGVPLLSHQEWLVLTRYLSQLDKRRSSPERDAALIVWCRGLLNYRGQQDYHEGESFHLMYEALSAGTRGGSFHALSDFAQELLLDQDRLISAHRNLTERLGVYFKFVRLLKRRGRFTEALQLLGLIAQHCDQQPKSEERILNEARTLLTIAKALGSHQNRLEQGYYLARLATQRSGPLRSSAALGRHASNTWLRSVDAQSRNAFSLKSSRAGDMRPHPDPRLFGLWESAAALDEAMNPGPSRARFALLMARVASAQDVQQVHALRRDFVLLLNRLGAGAPDYRGLSIRHAQYARILLRLDRPEDAYSYATSALSYAEIVCDWQSVSRALLLQAEALAAQGSRDRERSDVAALLSRGKRTLEKLEEPPLQLLLTYCQDQARQYLHIRDTKSAISSIEEALGYVTRLRAALRAEQEDLRASRLPRSASGRRPWQRQLTALLTASQRTALWQSIGSDWELISRAQEQLTGMLTAANQLAYQNSVYGQSAQRAAFLRSALNHVAENVVERVFNDLHRRIAMLPPVAEVLPRDAVIAAIKVTEGELVALFREEARERVKTDAQYVLYDIEELLQPDALQMACLRTFDPHLRFSIEIREHFELLADPDAFRIALFDFLMNAAQELSTIPPDGKHQLAIVARWDSVKQDGVVEISDSAGHMSQLFAGLAAARCPQSSSTDRNPGGLQRTLNYFHEMWECSVSATGEQDIRSTVVLTFPRGARVRKV